MLEKDFIVRLEGGRTLSGTMLWMGNLSRIVSSLPVEIQGEILCTARYDAAHGAPHQDIPGLHGGTLTKNWFFDSSHEKVFEHAVHDLKPMQKHTFVSFGKTDDGMAFVGVPQTRSEPFFTIKACDRILEAQGFRPATAEESRKFARFLK